MGSHCALMEWLRWGWGGAGKGLSLCRNSQATHCLHASFFEMHGLDFDMVESVQARAPTHTHTLGKDWGEAYPESSVPPLQIYHPQAKI